MGNVFPTINAYLIKIGTEELSSFIAFKAFQSSKEFSRDNKFELWIFAVSTSVMDKWEII